MNRKQRIVLISMMTVVILIASITIFMTWTKQPRNLLYQNWYEKYTVSYKNMAYINGGTQDKKLALSEAQGYGMLITVFAAEQKQADQESFDKLLLYYRKNTINGSYLMKWKQEQRHGDMITTPCNDTNATDGDLDIAYALFKANELWGSDGNRDYLKTANLILRDILKYNYNHDSQALYIGDWAKNDKKYAMLVRTSDLIPSYFNYFYEKTQDERWHILYRQSIEILSQLSERSSVGLIPDFIFYENKDITVANPNTIESKDDGNYGWNATRVPMRISYKTNQQQISIVDRKLLHFFDQQQQIRAVYDLNGKPVNNYSSMAFIAPLAVAANQHSKDFPEMSQKLIQRVRTEPLTGNYYGDTLQVLSMLMIDSNLNNGVNK